MTNLEKQHELVKSSLIKFISAHIPGADLSVVDEIVLSYIISILEETSEDPAFDVDCFVEMMGAYFEQFPTIDQSIICEWIYKLADELNSLNKKVSKRISADFSLASLSLSAVIPESKLRARNSSSSDKDDVSSSLSAEENGKRVQRLSECSDTDSNTGESCYRAVDMLQELFPDATYAEVKHCIAIAKGDIDSAAQILLVRQETGQALADKSLPIVSKKSVKVDDNELKNRIIERYSYLDKNESQREYRPVAPKMEPKKLVRYRDNKIVSLKGERYTEVKRDEDAELKKPKKPIHP